MQGLQSVYTVLMMLFVTVSYVALRKAQVNGSLVMLIFFFCLVLHVFKLGCGVILFSIHRRILQTWNVYLWMLRRCLSYWVG